MSREIRISIFIEIRIILPSLKKTLRCKLAPSFIYQYSGPEFNTPRSYAMQKDYIFTSESVTEGHPDKVCDQISDSVLDAILAKDPLSRVACECLVKTGFVVVAGEITTKAYVNIQEVVRKKILEIGYNHSDLGFDGHSCGVLTAIEEQSPDIAQGVNESSNHEQGAGDQGMMFGYAVNETDTCMPYSIDLAHRLAERLAEVRKSGAVKIFGPDGKTQVSVQYIDGKPKHLDTILVSTQHLASASLKEVEEAVRNEVIKKVVPTHLMDKSTKILVNPTGRFVVGGPMGDCGLTGRKIIVDTYGGHGAHGGGAFSGKDPSKVDRSAAYAARHVAKHIIACGLAEKALVQAAYAIGVAAPVSFFVNTFGTEKVAIEKLNAAINHTFNMKPRYIIERLNLLRPIYAKTASYGHFGRKDPDFSWEKLDKLEELKNYF
jgi:S-adenosylmethionine synthetase